MTNLNIIDPYGARQVHIRSVPQLEQNAWGANKMLRGAKWIFLLAIAEDKFSFGANDFAQGGFVATQSPWLRPSIPFLVLDQTMYKT